MARIYPRVREQRAVKNLAAGLCSCYCPPLRRGQLSYAAAAGVDLGGAARSRRSGFPPAGLHHGGQADAAFDHVLRRADAGAVPADPGDRFRTDPGSGQRREVGVSAPGGEEGGVGAQGAFGVAGVGATGGLGVAGQVGGEAGGAGGGRDEVGQGVGAPGLAGGIIYA